MPRAGGEGRGGRGGRKGGSAAIRSGKFRAEGPEVTEVDVAVAVEVGVRVVMLVAYHGVEGGSEGTEVSEIDIAVVVQVGEAAPRVGELDVADLFIDVSHERLEVALPRFVGE